MKHWIKIITFSLSMPQIAWAADKLPEKVTEKMAPSLSSAPSFDISSVAQMIIGLIFVVGLILILAWLSRRLGVANRGAASTLRMVAGMSVGTREKVVLIDVGGEQILLGVAPGRVNMLHHFSEPVAKVEQPQPISTPFAKQLNELLNKGKES